MRKSRKSHERKDKGKKRGSSKKPKQFGWSSPSKEKGGGKVRRGRGFFGGLKSERLVYSEVEKDFPILIEKYSYDEKFSHPLLKRGKILCEEYAEELANLANIESGKSELEGRLGSRIDLREECIFTIDGEDAKDFDDAVSIEKSEWGYDLGVHIADVSYFVKNDSGLDQEARQRGTSVYLIDKVIPMLPETISNYLCSLIQGEVRFTVSCLMKISLDGELDSYQFTRSMIKSRARLTYNQVESFLTEVKADSKNKKSGLAKEILSSLIIMNELKDILRNKRMNEGSIDFISQEQKFDLSKDKISVVYKEQLDSEKLIEEFMLMANRCAALELSEINERDKEKLDSGKLSKKRGRIGVYRVHESPKDEKLYQFEQVLQEHGVDLPKEGYHQPLEHLDKSYRPNRYKIFLEQLSKTNVEKSQQRLYSLLLLRSMNQAKYTTQNIGHYGLGFSHYTHFTSPIRRYPDLVVHRLLLGELVDRPFKILRKEVKDASKLSSDLERKAVEAEREYKKVKSIRYLAQLLENGSDKTEEGKNKLEFEATVVGFNGRGDMFVQDSQTGIEGMVSRGVNRSERYYFDDEEDELADKVYGLGDYVRVRLDTVNVGKLHANFSIINKN